METLQDSSEMAGPPKSVMSSGLTDSAALQGLEGYQIFLKWKQIKKKHGWRMKRSRGQSSLKSLLPKSSNFFLFLETDKKEKQQHE